MPVEDRLGCFKTDALVAAVEQLAEPLHGSFANLVRRPSGGFGQPPALPLVRPRGQGEGVPQ